MSNGEGSHLLIYRSIVHHNQANRYGGIANAGAMNIVNSTVSHNTSDIDTGGIMNTGRAALNNVTVAFNQGTLTEDGSADGTAAGIENQGTLYIGNSIVANNTNHFGTSQDCRGAINSVGYNLLEDTTDCTVVGDLTGNLIGSDPVLWPLANNGGLTLTLRLDDTSPARDAGNPAFPDGTGTACEPADQRDRARGMISAGRCDMGSYEVGGGPGGVITK